jgi:DNA-directed RNA polymerases I, II, and III subunit RPABC5
MRTSVRVRRLERRCVDAVVVLIFSCRCSGSLRYCAIFGLAVQLRTGILLALEFLCVMLAGAGLSAGSISLSLSILLHICWRHVLIIPADHSNGPEVRYDEATEIYRYIATLLGQFFPSGRSGKNVAASARTILCCGDQLSPPKVKQHIDLGFSVSKVLRQLELTNVTLLGKMIIPVRCFSCGKVCPPFTRFPFVANDSQVIGDLWERYLKMLEDDISDGDAMDQLRLNRYCCRRMIMTHVDLIEKLLKYDYPTLRSNKEMGANKCN